MSKISELIDKYCPDGVEFKTLGELGNFYGGLTGKSKDDFVDGNAVFITYKNVYSNLSLDIHPTERVKILDGEKQRTLEYGDVIFTGSSETPDECGFSSVVTETPDEPLYLNSFCFIYRFNDLSIINPHFAKYLFRSGNLRYQIGKTASGVTRYNVSKKLMEKVSIPIPPLDVQSEIALVLDTFTLLTNRLIEELTAELTARKQQYDFYRNKMLSFGENVQMLPLGDIGPVCMCKRILKSQTNTEGGVPFFKIGTFGKEPNAYISQETYDEYREKYNFPKKGEILISAAGTIGRTVVYDGEPAYFQDSNIVWISNDETKVLNEFLLYCYAMKPWQISEGGTIARLYNDNIRKAVIPVPTLEEQRLIVDTLKKFDSLCEEIQSELPTEISARQKQYEYYRDKLLTFEKVGDIN